jgi:hypothetical protein
MSGPAESRSFFFGIGDPILRAGRSVLTEKSVEVIVFPAFCSKKTVKFAFPTIELVRVNLSPAGFVGLLWNHSVKHFVVNHVFQEPGRYERGVKEGVYSNDSVLLLNGAEHEIFFRGKLPLPTPSDAVALQSTIEIFGIDLVEDSLEIKILTLGRKLQLVLHRKPFEGQFSFALSHRRSAGNSKEQIPAGNRKPQEPGGELAADQVFEVPSGRERIGPINPIGPIAPTLVNGVHGLPQMQESMNRSKECQVGAWSAWHNDTQIFS